MNNKMITIPYADAIEYGENTSAPVSYTHLDVYKRQGSQ